MEATAFLASYNQGRANLGQLAYAPPNIFLEYVYRAFVFPRKQL